MKEVSSRDPNYIWNKKRGWVKRRRINWSYILMLVELIAKLITLISLMVTSYYLTKIQDILSKR